MVKNSLSLFLTLFILVGCASRMKDELKDYRKAYEAQNFEKASSILEKSALKKDEKSLLLWKLEKGSISFALNQYDEAIQNFQEALELIDELYTTKLGSKAASFLINDASDEFYGSSYERSFAHYFLAKSLYQRYLQSGNKLDLQGARASILAWDTYFTELQRDASSKTLYHTDLMLKVFGGQVHEVSQVRNDRQIALQLYKDAHKILQTQGGIFSVFNKKSTEYVKKFESTKKPPGDKFYERTSAQKDLKDFLDFKILSLTKELRGHEFEKVAKALNASIEIKKEASKGSGNVVVLIEEGLIPQKVGKPFNFGLKGAINSVENKNAKKFLSTVGTEAVTAFAMNKLGMIPERSTGAGSFLFAHSVTRLAVQEAAIEFELPMIEEVPLVQRLEYFIYNEKGSVVKRGPLPIVSENGDIARIVLEEDVVSRYVKTGTRVAVRHLVAIVSAMKVYQTLKKGGDDSGDFMAKTAAMGTYIGASKGIALLEKADTRQWNTIPQAFRMTELSLPPGKYEIKVGLYNGDVAPDISSKKLGEFRVEKSGKAIHTFTYNP